MKRRASLSAVQVGVVRTKLYVGTQTDFPVYCPRLLVDLGEYRCRSTAHSTFGHLLVL